MIGIKQRLSTLTDPTTFNLANFDEKLLVEKCKLYDSVKNSVGNTTVWDSVCKSVSDSVHESVRDSVRDIVGGSVSKSVNESIRDSVRDYISESVWDSANDYVNDYIMDSVWDSVRDFIYIHAFSKFSRNEYESFLREDMNWEGTYQALKIHDKFRHVNWLWEHGLFCFRGIMKGSYYICSYSDKKWIRQVNILEDEK